VLGNKDLMERLSTKYNIAGPKWADTLRTIMDKPGKMDRAVKEIKKGNPNADAVTAMLDEIGDKDMQNTLKKMMPNDFLTLAAVLRSAKTKDVKDLIEEYIRMRPLNAPQLGPMPDRPAQA
jgi:hypothetical protein